MCLVLSPHWYYLSYKLIDKWLLSWKFQDQILTATKLCQFSPQYQQHAAVFLKHLLISQTTKYYPILI